MGSQPQQDHNNRSPFARQHHDDGQDGKNERINDHPGHRQSLRGQRRRDKDCTELKDQQDGKARIADPILPSRDRSPPVIHDDRRGVYPYSWVMGCLVLRIEPSITHFKRDSPAKTTLCRIWGREPPGFPRRYCKRTGRRRQCRQARRLSSTLWEPIAQKSRSPPRAGLASGRNRGISVSGRTEVPRNSDRPSSGEFPLTGEVCA